MNTAIPTTRLLFRYGTPDGCRWDTDFELSISPDTFDRLREKHRKQVPEEDVQPTLEGLTLQTVPDTTEVLKAFFGRGDLRRSSSVKEVESGLGHFTEWKYFFAWMIIEHGESLRILVVDKASAGHQGVTAEEREALARIRAMKEDGEYHEVITGNPGNMPPV